MVVRGVQRLVQHRGQRDRIEAEACVQPFELFVEQFRQMRRVAQRARGLGGNRLDAAVDAKRLEADAAKSQTSRFERIAQSLRHFTQQLL